MPNKKSFLTLTTSQPGPTPKIFLSQKFMNKLVRLTVEATKHFRPSLSSMIFSPIFDPKAYPSEAIRLHQEDNIFYYQTH